MSLYRGETVYPRVAQFSPTNGQIPPNITEGALWYDEVAQTFKAVINGVVTSVGGGGLSGSITSTQVAFGSPTNTITGNSNFTFNAVGGIFNVATANGPLLNLGGTFLGTTGINIATGPFAPSAQIILTQATPGNIGMQLNVGPSLILQLGGGVETDIVASSSHSIVKMIPSTGSTFQTTLTAAQNGTFQIAPTTSNSAILALGQTGLQISSASSASTRIGFVGATSGGAAIAIAAVAGSPNDIILPTATGGSGGLLTTNGGSPQQTSWTLAPTVNTFTVAAATPTGSAGQISFGNTTATSATAGANGAVPAQVAGYLTIDVAGTKQKVPYFNV